MENTIYFQQCNEILLSSFIHIFVHIPLSNKFSFYQVFFWADVNVSAWIYKWTTKYNYLFPRLIISHDQFSCLLHYNITNFLLWKNLQYEVKISFHFDCIVTMQYGLGNWDNFLFFLNKYTVNSWHLLKTELNKIFGFGHIALRYFSKETENLKIRNTNRLKLEVAIS